MSTFEKDFEKNENQQMLERLKDLKERLDNPPEGGYSESEKQAFAEYYSLITGGEASESTEWESEVTETEDTSETSEVTDDDEWPEPEEKVLVKRR